MAINVNENPRETDRLDPTDSIGNAAIWTQSRVQEYHLSVLRRLKDGCVQPSLGDTAVLEREHETKHTVSGHGE
jgi:hypothetical protein